MTAPQLSTSQTYLLFNSDEEPTFPQDGTEGQSVSWGYILQST